MPDALCASNPGIGLVIQWIILAFLALSSWTLLRTGRVSLGQQAYFGLGAYGAGLLTVAADLPLPIALLLAAIGGALIATLIAWPLRHLSGLHYAIATLAVAELVRLALSAFRWRFTGTDGRTAGPDGIQGFRDIRWLFEHEVSPELYLGFTASLLLLALLLLLQVERLRLGLALRALGLDAPLAAASALPVDTLRLASHTLAGALAALAGGLYAHQATYLEPAIFDAMLGIHAVGYAMIGGLATPLGPLLGAGLDLGLLEATRIFEGWRMVLFGGLVALFLRWRPRGLLDESLLHRLRSFQPFHRPQGKA